MSAIFDALPGLDAPVGSIPKSLAAMWAETGAHGRPAPGFEDVTASQVNYILHFGFKTTGEDALVQFRTAVRFSQRYPSRVVVLCPRQNDEGVNEIRAKVYGECFLGKTKGDTRCCEFVILNYPRNQRRFLENQVSVCLSTDLPVYYYAHRFSTSSGLGDYGYLLTRSKRVLIDSANAPAGTLSYPWPRPEAVRDLANSRLLHVRQSIGQFLSRYPMDVLCQGLESVTVVHGAAVSAEARVLLAWLKDRVSQCGQNRAVFRLDAPADSGASSCSVAFAYGGGAKHFSWSCDLASGEATIEADFGSGLTAISAAVSLLAPEDALSDAMFF